MCISRGQLGLSVYLYSLRRQQREHTIFGVKFPPEEVYLLFTASKTIREWICDESNIGQTNGNAPADVLSSLGLEDWTAPAFEVFAKWTKHHQATIPENSDIDINLVEDHLKLWELDRKLQAPAFQNAVMKKLIYLTDFYEQVSRKSRNQDHSESLLYNRKRSTYHMDPILKLRVVQSIENVHSRN
jgi:hypothetical protein